MKIEDIKYEIPTKSIDEKDFDLKKWRKENPMDYFKVMWLVNDSINAAEINRIIYNITRNYIPDTLFKYYSLTDEVELNNKKLETLIQKKIFMSDAKDLNDPFDNKAFFYRPNELKKYERLKRWGGKVVDDFTSFLKVVSLTSNGVNSMPMWAHYANNHKGFCVSYDTRSNTQLTGCTFPVQYTNQRVDVTSLIDKQVKKLISAIEVNKKNGVKETKYNDLTLIYLIVFFCNIKHISWEYENEFRCSIASNADGIPYVSAVPKEIFIGMNCLQDNEKKIIEIAKNLNVPVYKMKFNEFDEKFELIAEKI